MAQETEKRARICKRVIDEEAEAISFVFTNGKTLVTRLSEVEAVGVRLRIKGLSEKIQDAFAGAKGNTELAYGLASDMYDRLKAGEWREAKGEGEETPTLICTAIARAYGKDPTKVTAVWANMPDAQKQAFKKDAKVSAAVAEIRAERAKAKAAAATVAAPDVALFD